MCQCKMWVLSVVLSCFLVYSVTTFNVDSFNYAVYNGFDSSSMFGFSMALHKEGSNGWLIVGAPEAQSQYQRRVHRGGVVYKCPTNRDGGCTEIPFDTNGDMYDREGSQLDNKTEQWFGATVSSSGREEGPVVACAPRYTWYPRKRSRRDPVGTCYVANASFSQFNEYSPCRTYQWGYHRQGSCQAGFSAAISTLGDRLFIGAPGSWYWQGQMYSIDAYTTFKYAPEFFSSRYGAEGQIHKQSLDRRPAVFSTTEGTEQDDDSYMGYSTITGDFQGNKNPREESIAVGMPRGNFLRGVVLLFTWNLTDFRHFTSNQLGSYFGYALAASDVDGDGKLDLIVGAPMYTIPNNKDKYDVGRVYVIYQQREKGRFMVNDTLDGFNSRSRFGQALASLGDINQDGYGDFAIGAPYDGENNRGAVYIYHGSENGVRKKYSQVIFAEDVTTLVTSDLATFGFAITGGMDLDRNGYPDMAIGAYLSNRAFFFRSRPVIRVTAWVLFLKEDKTIDIDKTNYHLKTQDVEAVTTQLKFCASYHGKNIPSSINLDLQYILDSKKLLAPRMGFVDYEGQNIRNDTIRLYQNRTQCTDKPIEVYVRSDIRDKLSPLVAEVKYWMQADANLRYYEQTRNPTSTLTPILDLNSPPSKKDALQIANNCGPDRVCVPNLKLEVTTEVDKYMLVSGEKLALEIFVSNTGEEAFESTLDVKYPDTLYYDTSVNMNIETSVLCNTAENNTVKCDIGNPIPRDKAVHFKLFWKPFTNTNTTPSTYNFVVSVNSSNPENERTRSDNIRKVSIGILYSYQLELNGKAYPADLHVIPEHYTVDISTQTKNTSSEDRLPEEAIGPQVIHVFYLTNEGKTNIEETEIFFAWPSYFMTEDHEDFVYLVEPPNFSVTENLNLQCGPIAANYRDFRVLLSQKSIWERYHIPIRDYGGTSEGLEGTTPNPVKSEKGGANGTDNEEINHRVQNNTDPNLLHPYRNKTQTGVKVEIYQGEGYLGRGNFHQLRVGNLQYSYRCLRRPNGRDSEVPCGEEVVNFLQLGAGLSEGIQWQCKRNRNGVWEDTACANFQRRDEVTVVQIFEGGIDFVRDYRRIGDSSYFYRCVRKSGDGEKETKCGRDFSLSTENIVQFLQHPTIKTECKRLIDEEWRNVDCGSFIETIEPWRQTRTTVQIVQARTAYEAFGAVGLYNKVDNIDCFYRCLKIIDGRVWEIDCGPNFKLTESNIKEGKFRGVKIRTECKKIIDGQLSIIDCGNLFAAVEAWKQPGTVVQVVQSREAFGVASFHFRKVDNADYFYRCVDGTGREVDCGASFILTAENLRGFFLEGKFRGVRVRSECKNLVNGQSRPIDCIRLIETVESWRQPETIIEIVQARTYYEAFGVETTYQKKVDNTNYFYRCLQNQREVDCGSTFLITSENLRKILEGEFGGIRIHSECKKVINGQSTIIDCNGLFETVEPWKQPETVIEIVQARNYYEAFGVETMYQKKVDNTNYFYRCLQDQREVNCGSTFIITPENLRRILLEGEFGGIKVHSECKKWINGQSRIINCATLLQPETQPEITVQIVQARSAFEAFGSESFYSRRIDNTDYFYRCIQDTEVDCAHYFIITAGNVTRIFQGIAGLKVHPECTIVLNGQRRATNCGTFVQTLSLTERIIQIVQARTEYEAFGAESLFHRRVEGTNYFYRCLEVNGGERVMDCGTNFMLTGGNITTFLQQGQFQGIRVRTECKKWTNGQLKTVDCRTLHEPVKPWKPTAATVQVVQARTALEAFGSESLYHRRVDRTNYFYRCLKKIDNEEREVDCGPFILTIDNIGSFFQQGMPHVSGIQHSECKKMVNGQWRTIDCHDLLKSETLTRTRIQIVQAQSAYDAFGSDSSYHRRVDGTNYFYRCLQDDNGVETEVDCSPNNLLTAANITEFLQQGGGVHRKCRESVNGIWRTVDCESQELGKLQMGGEHVSYTCYMFENDGYTLRDCGSPELLQKGSGIPRCLQSVDGGDRKDIPCEEVVEMFRRQSQIHGGTYNQSYEYSSRRGAQSNYDVPSHSQRNPKTYGRNRNQFAGQNVIENAALGTGGFQTYALDVNPLQTIDDNYETGRDNVPTERATPKQGFYGRKKRQVPDEHPSIDKIRAQYPCRSVQCMYMRCTVQNLEQGKQLAIALRGRVNGRIFNRLKLTDSVSFSSLMVARVRRLPQAGVPAEQEPIYHEITTTVKKTEAELKPETVPLWVVVLSAVAGTIILLLLVFLLYKLGFFKRNRPSSAPERQPLNRNGYHHDDEVL